MINVVTMLKDSGSALSTGTEGLFGPAAPSRVEIAREILKQLERHDDNGGATAGLRDEDDDQWIVDDDLKALAALGLAEVSDRREVVFYRISDTGRALLNLLQADLPTL